jgi:DedD protein
MAERKAAEDEFNPRHRIVGAVILVALAVIFLPMLLSDRPPSAPPAGTGAMPTPETRVVVTPVPLPGVKPQTAQPPADKADATSRTVTVPVDGAPGKPPGESEKPKPARTVADIVDAAPVTPPAADRKPAGTPTATEPKPAKPASGEKGKWVVQVGVFSHADNAARLRDQLRHKGYSVTLDPPVAEKGKTMRVEVGPYKDQAAAKAAAARIQSDIGIKGVVRSD